MTQAKGVPHEALCTNNSRLLPRIYGCVRIFKYQQLFTDKKYDIISRKDLERSFVWQKKIIEGLRRLDYGEFGDATAV